MRTEHSQTRCFTENDVLPIFQMRCAVCHGKRRQEGGLDLRFQASRLKGGESGPALIPGKPDESLLMQKITSGQMPPPKLLVENSFGLSASTEVEKLRQWIAAGAPAAPPVAAAQKDDTLVSDKDRSFWSFQPPKRPQVPAVRRSELARNAVDNFLLQKLEANDLSYAPPAEPITAIDGPISISSACRPPHSRRCRRYARVHAADAYERMIDRLLTSPRYGERMGKLARSGRLFGFRRNHR